MPSPFTKEFDFIFNTAMDKARAVKCSPKDFASALDGWRNDIEIEIEATGVTLDDDEEDDEDDDDLDDEDEDEDEDE